MIRFIGLVLLGNAACGNISRKSDDDGAPHDATIIDTDGPTMPDAPPMVGQSREVVSGARRVSGPTYTFDIEIGHPFQQKKITGTTYTLEGNAAVKP